MPEDNEFQLLIDRLRAGDEAAATELVQRYESKVRRVVRFNDRLRSRFDSEDISQSVMKSFFVRARLGQFEELHTPEQVLKLLTTMARNKLRNQIKFHTRERRDYHRATSGNEEQVHDAASSPSQQVVLRELLSEVPRRLSEEENQLLRLRDEGKEWAEIAVLLGGSAEALRKKFERARERVTQELGLDE